MNRKMMSTLYKIKNKIPFWIDTKVKLHHQIWNKISDCNNILFYNLIVREILPYEVIDDVIVTLDDEINKILNIGYDVEIYVYYHSINEYIINLLLQWEEYEAAHNLQRVLEIYFNIKYDNLDG